jgi:SAM-dependent methyltransferase
MSSEEFEWTPDFWQGWREEGNSYRRHKSLRDCELALQILKLREGENVLEVGCGYGWISRALWDAARIRWCGVDRSITMVRQLRRTFDGYGPRAICAEAGRLPFRDGEFDKVLCTGVLMHISEDEAAVREIVRVLRPGGTLLCSINNLFSPYSLPVRIWNRRKQGFVQKFLSPFRFAKFLRASGIQSIEWAGDGIFATVNCSLGPLQFPPAFAFPLIRRVDEWFANHLAWLAYEIWLSGVKVAKPCES